MRRPLPPAARLSRLLPAVAAALALPGSALAEGTALRADLVQAKAIKIDGVPKEWSGLASLGYAVRGRAARPDVEARAAIAYDDANVYIAADVTDDVLRPGADRVEIALGFPGGTVSEIQIFPGDPGKSPGSARHKDGAAIAGARVVEAPRSGGWSLEASVPWSAFPQAKLVRVGLRGALFVHDADSGSSVKNVVGTAPSNAYATLPPLSTETEQALADGLIKDKSIRGGPRYNLLADVAGDAMKERVLVYDRYFVVLGPHFRKGSEYFWQDIGVDADRLPSCEVRDLTGDGQAEVIFRKRLGSPTKYREMMQVVTFGSGETPITIFQHELGVTTDAGSINNTVSFVQDGARTAIKISAGAATGFTAASYREPTETGYDPVLLPWGTIASQTYKLSGATFVKASEEKQAAAAVAAPPRDAPSLPKPPPPPSASELLDKVYDLWKRERGAAGRPRFDLAVDVAGDRQVERVLLHDRDIVVFGKGFRGGTGYSYLALQQFASASDIVEMTARDVTGDGKAEIVVKGVMHANAPREAGGGTIDREVVLVFTVTGDSIKRVFAAEIGRAIGKKKIVGSIQLTSAGIEIAPGRAVEWTEQTYPFGQDTGTVGGFEPLLLPWGGSRAVRYHWAAGAFTR